MFKVMSRGSVSLVPQLEQVNLRTIHNTRRPVNAMSKCQLQFLNDDDDHHNQYDNNWVGGVKWRTTRRRRSMKINQVHFYCLSIGRNHHFILFVKDAHANRHSFSSPACYYQITSSAVGGHNEDGFVTYTPFITRFTFVRLST